MIIDCHGHYTTAPPALGEFREAQKAALATDPDHVGEKGAVAIGDDEIRESLEGAQLRLQRERGTDLTLFSPRASWMGHHIGNRATSESWSARTIRTREGGMICASVPEAAITPEATRRS